MWNSYCVGHTNMEQSPAVIVLNTQTQISHRVHVYYITELFNLFCSVLLVVRNFKEVLSQEISISYKFEVRGLNFTQLKHHGYQTAVTN